MSESIAIILIVMLIVFAVALVGGVICLNIKDRKLHEAWENQKGN